MAINPLIALQARNADIGGSISRGVNTASQLQSINESKARVETENANREREKELVKLRQAAMGGDREALSQVFALDPDSAKKVFDLMGATSDFQREDAARRASELLALPFEQRRSAILSQAQELDAQGRDPKDTLSLLQLSEEDQNRALNTVEMAALNVKERREARAPGLSNFKTTEGGGVVGFDKTTGSFREVPLPPGVAVKGGGTTVNVNNAAEKGLTEEQKELAKGRVSELTEIRQKALAAEEQNAGLDSLENIDVETGLGQGAISQVARAINALGGDGAALTGVDPANVQAFNAVSGKLVLDVMSTQKGPQTDKDQERIAKTIPSIKNEESANKFILGSLRALNLRRIEQANFWESYLEKNGTLTGVQRAWFDFKRNTPMLSDQVKNADSGLPMFFHEFQKQVRERNPGVSDEQIISAWREVTGGK